MQTFTRILILCGIMLVISTAYYASTHGIGVKSLNNRQVIEQTKSQPGTAGSQSYFSGRTIRGGGPRYGK